MKLGIELVKNFKDIFKDKKVGLITNHTGLDQNFKSSIDILNEVTDLRALYAPEHGIRGDIQAGQKLDTYIDEKTGLTVFSLYGATKKPTDEMLKDIDVLCFDIQDVGARYYTYIYTMAYSMIAAKENNKEFVVFDRPNPLGGKKIEGNMLDLEYRSFIGYYPMLQRHGLTIGELAKMFNEEYGIGVKLHVVKMEGWRRDQEFDDLDLSYVLPSPNLPTVDSVYNYLATCIFEGTNLSEGRGTTKPFSFIGAPWLKNTLIIEELRKLDIKGVAFREVYFTPTFSKHKDVLCKGIELLIKDKAAYEPVILSMILLKLVRKHHEEFDFIKPYTPNGHPFINLLVGDNFIKEDSLNILEIKEKFNKDQKIFKAIKEKYELYD
ncbi:exo-beta-N-acetylmuramidase NamZ family protein [Haploplasma modicum]|uniref:exo-beta-N-acetylmuramidase NamZ family protein n=1 Tax=Haploplasma modicum TaxID=2150 RepID=UPI00214C41DA|nr:DUF1343 domain-containing protein [Haploplasma modicum]MCR1809366.1 DUF1343 domain-containing protein [Haploplasma modicum]